MSAPAAVTVAAAVTRYTMNPYTACNPYAAAEAQYGVMPVQVQRPGSSRVDGHLRTLVHSAAEG